MKLIEQTFSEPAENVAFDEALLLDAEQLPGHSGFLRIWEPDQIFVVVEVQQFRGKSILPAAEKITYPCCVAVVAERPLSPGPGV